ncbi:MAG TPA: hypothetical protein PKA56_00425 [Solirubrobacterales bacterium]|jgi:hypothetical protein|nr:hypothetical protein [Solirubrobacterales bacterium]HMU26809.1 hypothetical protein [Solirubrobacterales bacterium]HMW44331.1 hypothetical protein [Solirubrobacterales bacterium]HMX70199.1 hypothetical protein [Solirubrobacterales bacterium]HMY25745.1 hypothetical protein [Solirubrobacterales bacterium]
MSVISHVSRESKATAVVLLLAWLAVAALSVTVALIAAPAFALFFVLSLGFFPGEQLIVKARELVSRPREWSRPVPIAAPVLPFSSRPVGLDLAFALAVRPPPVLQ